MGISLMIKQTNKIFQFKSEEITLMKVILYNLKKTNTHSHGKHIQHKNSKEKMFSANSGSINM